MQENDKKEKKKITLRHRTHDPCNSRAVSTTIPRLPGIAIEAVQILCFGSGYRKNIQKMLNLHRGY